MDIFQLYQKFIFIFSDDINSANFLIGCGGKGAVKFYDSNKLFAAIGDNTGDYQYSIFRIFRNRSEESKTHSVEIIFPGTP